MRLSLFAILFQVILFGWHHHELPFAGHLPVLVFENPTAAPQLADDENGCEICHVQLTTAPVYVVGAPSPLGLVAGSCAVGADLPLAAARSRFAPTLHHLV